MYTNVLTVCRSSILVFTPMAISRLSPAVSGQGYSVARKLQRSRASTIQRTKESENYQQEKANKNTQLPLPLTNLLHSAFELISLEENDEDTLVNLVTSAWILKWSFNLSLLEEHITTTGTPQKTLKRRYSLTSYHSSYKSSR